MTISDTILLISAIANLIIGGAMIYAVVKAPQIAVHRQREMDIQREQRLQKLWIYKTLMMTRATPISPAHVQALNLIALEFTAPSDKGVLDAWKTYHAHLKTPQGDDEAALRWNEKTQQLLTCLLSSMGKALGFDFLTVDIESGAYVPDAQVITDLELRTIIHAAASWLNQNGSVPITLKPISDASAKQGQEFLDATIDLVKGRTHLKVDLLQPDQANQAQRQEREQ